MIQSDKYPYLCHMGNYIEELMFAFSRRKMVDLPPLPGQQVMEPNEQPCYVFNNMFSPVAVVPQVQLLTNSIVQTSLPDSILGNAVDNTAEEDERVKEYVACEFIILSVTYDDVQLLSDKL